MADTLTTLITKVQALLGGDDGTIFNTAICTAGAREALKVWNKYLPVNAGDLIDGVSDQYEYELTDTDSRALRVSDVLLLGDDGNEIDISIGFDEYNEDERIFFRLRSPVVTGDTLVVRYPIPQTINGLDSETETTIPAWLIPAFVTGMGAETLRIRARSRTESINLSKDQSDNYLQQAQEMKTEYIGDLVDLGRNKKPAVGEPDQRAWNDAYHYWAQ